MSRYSCSSCGKACSMQCSRCKLEYFCDKACFKRGWRKHKKICIPGTLQTEESSENYELATESMLVMERENIGNLAGTNMTSIIGGFLGIPEALAGKARNNAQQALMLSDRIPVLRAVFHGNFSVFQRANGKELSLSNPFEGLEDGVICYAEYRVRHTREKKTTQDFALLQPASLALELRAWSTGLNENGWEEGLSPFKLMDGGLMYLVGEESLFWSMVLNLPSGSTVPPNPPNKPLEDLYMCKEMDRTYDITQNALRSAAVVGSTGKVNIGTIRSKSLAYIQSLKQGLSPFELLESDEHIPSEAEQLPQWWKDIAAFWDGIFTRSGMLGPGSKIFRPQCMFASTPAGCAHFNKGNLCCAWHDPHHLSSLQTLIEQVCVNDKAREFYSMLKELSSRIGEEDSSLR